MLLRILPLALCAIAATAQPTSVVIVGVDGLMGAGIDQAETPNLDAMKANGAWTFKARGVMPTSSSPNWASMIMGAGPEQHGVTSNAWEPDDFPFGPICTGMGTTFPTIFSLMREQRPTADTAVFHHWKGFGRLVEPGAPSHIEHGETETITTEAAIAYWKEHQPALLFVHLDHVDHAGHTHEWLSEEYRESVELADELIGKIRDAIDHEQTFFIVTADHGGVGKKHGGESPEEIHIPWLAEGPGIAAGVTIRQPVNTYDTAATAAHVLGVSAPNCWIGRPVRPDSSAR